MAKFGIKVGRQSFAAEQGVNACRLQPSPVGMGMPTYKKPLAAGQGCRAATLCRRAGAFLFGPQKNKQNKTLLLFKEESPPQAGEVVWLMSAWECRPT